MMLNPEWVSGGSKCLRGGNPLVKSYWTTRNWQLPAGLERQRPIFFFMSSSAR